MSSPSECPIGSLAHPAKVCSNEASVMERLSKLGRCSEAQRRGTQRCRAVGKLVVVREVDDLQVVIDGSDLGPTSTVRSSSRTKLRRCSTGFHRSQRRSSGSREWKPSRPPGTRAFESALSNSPRSLSSVKKCATCAVMHIRSRAPGARYLVDVREEEVVFARPGTFGVVHLDEPCIVELGVSHQATPTDSVDCAVWIGRVVNPEFSLQRPRPRNGPVPRARRHREYALTRAEWVRRDGSQSALG